MSVEAIDRAFPLVSRLGLRFDVGPVAAEVGLIPDAAWGVHRSAMGKIDREDGWSALSLRAIDGDVYDTSPGRPGRGRYEDTPLLAELPRLSQLIRGFPFPADSIRLSALHPGGRIAPHRGFLGLDKGKVRLHLPLISNPGAIISVGGQTFCWGIGELWYADFSKEHFVKNHGASRRVHLIIDALVSDGLFSLFSEEQQALFQRAKLMSSGLITEYASPRAISLSKAATYECSIRCGPATDADPIHELLNRMLATSRVKPQCQIAFRPGENGLMVACDGKGVAELEEVGEHLFRVAAGFACDTFEFLFVEQRLCAVRIRTFNERHLTIEVPTMGVKSV